MLRISSESAQLELSWRQALEVYCVLKRTMLERPDIISHAPLAASFTDELLTTIRLMRQLPKERDDGMQWATE